MMIMIHIDVDNDVTCKQNTYTVHKQKQRILLKKISIKKQPLSYAFLGGMWYTKNDFSFHQQISLPHPFNTYYTLKILDESYHQTICRSLLYVKMPLLVLQLSNTCIAIEFDPVITINDEEVFPFLCLEETEDHYIISFLLFTTYRIKEKKHAWLGFGHIQTKHIQLHEHDSFSFRLTIKQFSHWTDAVDAIIRKNIPKNESSFETKRVFHNAKKALQRSYDHRHGCFLQLPWRETPGFTFVGSSYTLLTYEAVRLHYFSEIYQKTKDIQFQNWCQRLLALFKDSNLHIVPKETGKGIIWYNMTTLSRKGLLGYFYMGCGYSGYPGGQATIAYHLLSYLEMHSDETLENLVHKSLEYILSTQKENGSWPMALQQEGFMIFRPEKLELYETWGGTAECARALLKGYKKFGDEKQKTAALEALSYLSDEYPICYNGLRDIGINEAEAFSSISIINAFLDAYEITHQKHYLHHAKQHAYYLLSWFYLYNTKNLKMKYQFHPISFSITPRLSPYETIWVVQTLKRLSRYLNDELWDILAKQCYAITQPWVSDTGGLSEGIFPDGLTSFHRLPMEQTFATTELLYTSFQLSTTKDLLPAHIKKPSQKTKGTDIHIKQKHDEIHIFYKKELLCIFDIDAFRISYIKDANLGEKGILFSFGHVYSNRNRSRQKIIFSNRGLFGRYILALQNIPYYLKGVEPPILPQDIVIDSIAKYITLTTLKNVTSNSFEITALTPYHILSMKVSTYIDNKSVHILFDPFNVEVRAFDLTEKQQIFIPYVAAEASKITNHQLTFPSFYIKGNFPRVIKKKTYTAVDHTLSTNWTHGGIFHTAIEIVLPF